MTIFKYLVDLLGEKRVIKGDNANFFLTDWRNRFKGNTIAVVFPKNTIEISKIVKLCIYYKISIVPQGGNTSLCGGATPDLSGNSIIISTKLMNNIRNINIQDDVVIVEAGCILKNIQEYVNQYDRSLPLSIASEGTCTIGGNLSTNAGGTQVLRYGNAREFALGLEVVTAEGLVLDNLKSLRKDNSGYSLRDLYIGSEGTLGIITAATLKIYHQPSCICTALIYVDSIKNSIELLNYSKSKFGSDLITFEIMSKNSFELSLNFINEVDITIDDHNTKWIILIEINGYENEIICMNLLEQILIKSLENNIITNAIIAKNFNQRNSFWKIRESIPLAEFKLGKAIKHDISLPISCINTFITTTNNNLLHFLPGAQFIIFGHLGDGNLHYNIFRPKNIEEDYFLLLQSEVYNIVHNNVYKFNGSICAEHGVGQLKVAEIKKYKNPLEIDLMRKIKLALDPHNIMNPGKIF